MNKNCAACCSTIEGDDYFKCSRCSDFYHHLCLNYYASEDISNELKVCWLCPSCINKQPKGDNSNSLIRPSTPTGLADITFTATRRKPQNKQETASVSFCSECVSRSDIKEMISNEMKKAFQVCLAEFNKSLNTQLENLNEKFSEIKGSIEFMNNQFELFKSNVHANNEELKVLKKKNELLRSEVNSLN
ncbi:unnamed protein product [Diatraea saccharalis]|uniref:PHD-type domain-containing protein n=1 Tax=Diatraea saccharalis TaxID=40085 RepID=A0A9N9R6F8_9NEOP|nr:unnamed protein product [Diatraea saccharalis]